MDSGTGNNQGYYQSDANVPYLVIINQPRQKVRYRYASETRKEGHGYLRAENNGDPKSKTWVTVQLENWYGMCDVFIRCSLVTPEFTSHINLLRRKCNDHVTVQPYQDEMLKFTNNQWIAEFSYLSILQELLNKDDEEKKRKWKSFRDVVILKFEAYTCNGVCISIPVYSHKIRNAKNPNEDDLSILEVSKSEGLCTGGEKVLIFVKKVNKKNIGIRFFQTWGPQYYTCWTAEAHFSPADVHGGLGISFKTPPYHDLSIPAPVVVQFKLYYRNDESVFSDPRPFTYMPVNAVARQPIDIPRGVSQPNFQSQCSTYSPQSDTPHRPGMARHYSEPHGNYPGFYQQSRGFPPYEQCQLQSSVPQRKSEATPLNIPSDLKFPPDEFLITDDSNLSVEDELGVFLTFSADQMGQIDSVGAGIVQMVDQDLDDLMEVIAGVESDSAETSPLPRISRPLSKPQSSVLGKKICARDSNGENALHRAVWRKQIDVVRDLLAEAKGSDNGLKFINTANRIGWTPLHASVLGKQTEVTTLLLESGADPNLMDIIGNTPIHLAAANGQLIDCLRVVIDKMQDINVRNNKDLTPFHLAVSNKNTEGAKLLMEKGADVTCKEKYGGNSALHTAVEKSAVDILKLLLKNESVDVNLQRTDGKTVLDLAKDCESRLIRKMLENPDDIDSELSSDESEFTSEDESENEFSDRSIEEDMLHAVDKLKIEGSTKSDKADDKPQK